MRPFGGYVEEGGVVVDRGSVDGIDCEAGKTECVGNIFHEEAG